ncbi:MAG: hypothetical protein ACW98X_23955 [Promethearchaeota archaeon]|jgi:hypothetical protein
MIDNKTYENLIRNGERVDWYGVEVPEGLITNYVKVWSSGLKGEIDKLEGTLSDLRGTSLDKRKGYIKSLMSNLQNAPYSLNGDVYLIKKKRIESQIEEENKKKKPVRKRKTTKRKTTTSKSTVTKNSSLIFGKK